ncbi:MAG: hypothetical protein ACM3PS_16760 [Syntrophothermus sp.]
MATNQTEFTLQIARRLVGRLPEPDKSELKSFLERAGQGEDMEFEMIELLSAREGIRLWIKEQLAILRGQTDGTRGYTPLAGRPSSIPTSQGWVCANGHCRESFPVIQEDEDPPVCDVHGTAMIRASKKG